MNAASHSREKFQLVVMEPMTDAPVNVIPTVYCCCGTIIYVECLHRLSFLWPHDTIALAPFSKELRNICMGQAIYPVPTNTVKAFKLADGDLHFHTRGTFYFTA